jgi:hypothetical protein
MTEPLLNEVESAIYKRLLLDAKERRSNMMEAFEKNPFYKKKLKDIPPEKLACLDESPLLALFQESTLYALAKELARSPHQPSLTE